MDRYGKSLAVNGSDFFKDQIIKTAIKLKLDITFDDPALEQRRQIVTQSLTTESNNERRKQSTNEHGRPNRSGDENIGPVKRINVNKLIRRPDGTINDRRINKPNVGRIGQFPPPESKNRLRNLSQLSVVQLSSGSKVLLPSDVSSHLEHQRTEPDNGVRRDVSRSGSITSLSAAADKYIAERELMRQRISDIPKHRRYHQGDEGTVHFAGIRQIDNEMLALLKKDEQIIVLPIDIAMARRIKRLSVGDNVKLTKIGIVLSKIHKR